MDCASSQCLLLSDKNTHAGFEDYGAYWRYNYETIEDDIRYKYTRDQLMDDVRSVYKEVRLRSVRVCRFASDGCFV